MRVGLISDTHLPSLIRSLDAMGPDVRDALAGAKLILHGGDVTAPSVVEWCGQLADVLVAEGNNDLFVDPRMKERQFVDIHGFRVGMAHELRPESRPLPEILQTALGGEHVDILIGGDTHVERLEFRDDVLLVNSGSPTFPHHLSTRLGSVGWLDIEPGRIRAEIVALGPTEDSPNPVKAQHVVIESGRVREASLMGVPLTARQFLQSPADRLAFVTGDGAPSSPSAAGSATAG